MEQQRTNDTFKRAETPIKDEFIDKASNSPTSSKVPLNRTLRLEYNQIMKLIKEQATEIEKLKSEIKIIKKVLTGRK